MKAIVVDCKTKSVSEINIATWQDIGPAINAEIFACPAGDEKGNTIYCDDEGLLHENVNEFIYCPAFYGQPLAGSILFLGSDDEGESKDVTLTVDEVKGMVSFLSRDQIISLFSMPRQPAG